MILYIDRDSVRDMVESKQRQLSESNRETHSKNSVKRIRSITSALSVMEANKLTEN